MSSASILLTIAVFLAVAWFVPKLLRYRCPQADPLCRPDHICRGCLRAGIAAVQVGMKPPTVIYAGRIDVAPRKRVRRPAIVAIRKTGAI